MTQDKELELYSSKVGRGDEGASINTAPVEFEQLADEDKMREVSGAQQGWQCPICNNIYSPWNHECNNCNRPVAAKFETTSGKDSCYHEFEIFTDGTKCKKCGSRELNITCSAGS